MLSLHIADYKALGAIARSLSKTCSLTRRRFAVTFVSSIPMQLYRYVINISNYLLYLKFNQDY